jgi:hypothetical protein
MYHKAYPPLVFAAICLFIVSGASGGEERLPADMLLGDITVCGNSMNEKEITALLPLDLDSCESDLPPALQQDKKMSSKKNIFAQLTPSLYFSCKKNKYDKNNAGALHYVKGTLVAFSSGMRIMQGADAGKLVYHYVLVADDLEPAYDLTPPKAGEFDAAAYVQINEKALLSSPRIKSADKFPLCKIAFKTGGISELPDVFAKTLKIKKDLWQLLAGDGNLRVFLPSGGAVDLKSLAALPGGQEVELFGRAFVVVENGKEIPGLLLDRFMVTDKVTTPKYFSDRRKLGGLLEEFAKSGAPVSLKFIFRNSSLVTQFPASIGKIAGAESGLLLESRDNDLPENLAVYLPVALKLPPEIEPGDTLLTEARIVQTETGWFALVIGRLELAPLQAAEK